MSKVSRLFAPMALLIASVIYATPASAIIAGYSQPYAELSKWSIFKDPENITGCFAQSKGQGTMMRITYSDHFGDWELQFALWREPHEIEAQFTFGSNSAELKAHNFIRTLTWARLSLGEDQVDQLRSEASLTLKTRGETETFSLSGSTKAMSELLKCAREE